ncbi:hypothetical protein AB0L70_31470 [Kribbella sp. NPDC051952]|uniref:hypothetical protein n=1 Tax=Kribbella sp. NPDC051952 TaxID=3154851 RepID=UPI0034153BD6
MTTLAQVGTAPQTARLATSLWLVAVGAGVVETVVQVTNALGDGDSMSSLAGQIAIRAVIYGALFVIIDRYFRRGVRWSRYFVAGLLGTVGVASLVSEPIDWLVSNGDLTTVDWTATSVTIAVLRTVHLTAVLSALALSLHPQTARWFNAKSRSPK